MAVALTARLAAAAPAPLYAVIGADALADVEDLSLDPALSLQSSPRHAGILFVAGPLREADREPLYRLHDQLPHPRATVWWRSEPDPAFSHPTIADADPADRVAETWRRLVTGQHPSEADLLADEPPMPWRGRGDHGQGGVGMMGGKPYGRPLAMTDDDRRDGLTLDAYTACFGPFAPMLPPGLQLELTLQGDVIQSAKVRRAPFAQAAADTPLRRIARLLRLLGLEGLAVRVQRQARVHDRDVQWLRRRLRWSGAMHAIPPALGSIGNEDVRARLCRWLAQADSMRLEAPLPPADERLVDLLPGLEWSEAILVANSFEPDVLLHLCPLAGPSDQEDEC